MRIRWAARLLVIFAAGLATAQQAGSPAEMKSPADPTAQQQPASVAKPQSATPPQATSATAADNAAKASVLDAAPAEEKVAIPTTTIYPPTPDISFVDPSLAPLTLPKGKLALIGGVVKEIDPIRNKMTVDIFGKGGKMKMLFDPRTHVDRNGLESNQLAIKKGDRVYVDTQLVNHKIFARNIYVRSNTGSADAAGQIAFYNPRTRELTMHDQLSQGTVTFALLPSTVIKDRGITGSLADLQPEALIEVRLTPAAGKRSTAKEINVLATPGSQFTFFGTLTHLDLRSGIFSVQNKSDNKLYDIRLPSNIAVDDNLKEGSEVAVDASFNGRDYTARSLKLTPPSSKSNNPE